MQLRHHIALIFPIGLTLTSAFACRPSSEPAELAIVCARVWTGTGQPAIEDGVVLIRGDRIVAVDRASEVVIPSAAAVLELPGGTVLPGFIDNHVHLRRTLMKGDGTLASWLRSGVTTLVDVGTLPGGVGWLRRRAKELSPEGPRIVAAGPVLTAPGGYPAPYPESTEDKSVFHVRGDEQARLAVRRLVDEEAVDLVKIAIETGFLSDIEDQGWPTPTPSELRAVTRAAHERGLTVRAHVTQSGELEAALDAGLDAVAHAPVDEIPEPLLRRAAARGFVLVTTASMWSSDRRLAAAVVSNLARYVELGGRIALGTDAPGQHPAGILPMREIRFLESGGVPRQAILLAATRWGAESLGWGDRLGSLEPGKLADLVVVDGDPLRDLDALERVVAVVAGGRLVE